jgi:hypothetical protein
MKLHTEVDPFWCLKIEGVQDEDHRKGLGCVVPCILTKLHDTSGVLSRTFIWLYLALFDFPVRTSAFLLWNVDHDKISSIRSLYHRAASLIDSRSTLSAHSLKGQLAQAVES